MTPSAKAGPEDARDAELRRIGEAYRHYDTHPAVQARRDPGNPGVRAIGAEIRSALDDAVRGISFPDRGAVCDVGCGTGGILDLVGKALDAQHPRLYGVDILPDRVERAKSAVPYAQFWVRSGESLPFPDRSIQLLMAATLFSSILDPTLAERVAREMWRVMADRGHVVGYDFRYPNPGNRRTRRMGLGRWCQLFPHASITAQSITLVPPLARRLGRLTGVAYPPLARVPALRTHYLVTISRPGRGQISGSRPAESERGSG